MWKYLKDEKPEDHQKCFVCWKWRFEDGDYEVGIGVWLEAHEQFCDILYTDGQFGFPGEAIAWMPLVFPPPIKID